MQKDYILYLNKLQAVKAAPTPRNVSELKSYLGLLTYYGKFLPNSSTRLQSLYQLLAKDCQWKWAKAQEKAFQESKNLLQSSQLLVQFDPQLPILACDASAFVIRAVLAHRMPDGYASRTLNKAERNYSQLEKEGLSCVFGVKHFYSYLFGHSFELVTDHKPLLGEQIDVTTSFSERHSTFHCSSIHYISRGHQHTVMQMH